MNPLREECSTKEETNYILCKPEEETKLEIWGESNLGNVEEELTQGRARLEKMAVNTHQCKSRLSYKSQTPRLHWDDRVLDHT